MTTKSISIGTISLAASLLVASGQTNAPVVSATPADAAPQLSPIERAIADIKHPVSWMTWGADLRVRNEYYNNAVTHNDSAPLHEQDYFRFRTRVWTSITPIDDLSLNARLTAEPREYMKPSDAGYYKNRTGVSWNYGIIDILNLQWRNIMQQPLTFTVGRQEIMLNDNWLTGDGTPIDGSWTAFTDAGRLTYNFAEQHTTLDVIGIVQSARDDEWLPAINHQNRALTDQNEKGAIVNLSNKSIKQANVDAYFMYKGDSRMNVAAPAGVKGDNADIFTLGGRLSGMLTDNWKYSSEGAYQFGRKQDALLNDTTSGQQAFNGTYRDINAFGVNDRIIYQFNDPLKNQVGMVYEFLSGDKSGTHNDEMFDVLWGRYPRWSDLVNVQGDVRESRVAQIGNLHRFGPTWAISPIKKLDLTANYFVLFADQGMDTRVTPATPGNPVITSGSDTFRGHLLTAVARYKFNQHVSTMLQGEVLFPGEFYAARDTESFLRAEVNFTF